MQLDPRASAAGVRLVAHEVLGSTNAEALGARAARASAVRSGSPPAGRPRAAAGAAGPGCRSPAISLRACCSPTRRRPSIGRSSPSSRRWRSMTRWSRSRRRSSPQLAIKWPNDLLLAGEKFAGILIEGEGGDDGAVAVGIGVNCAQPSGGYRLSGDRSRGRRRARSPPKRCSGRCRPRCSGGSRNGTRRGLLPPSAPTGSRAPPVVGEEIRVRLADREVVGRFEALDEAGGLVLRRCRRRARDHRRRRRGSSRRRRPRRDS